MKTLIAELKKYFGGDRTITPRDIKVEKHEDGTITIHSESKGIKKKRNAIVFSRNAVDFENKASDKEEENDKKKNSDFATV